MREAEPTLSRLRGRLRERVVLRLRILRLLRVAGPRLVGGVVAFQLFTGVAPVAFIVATSAVVGRVPAAAEAGLGSAAWESLRNALLVAGVLFVIQQLSWPFQWSFGELVTWRVDDVVRERVAAASFEPVGVAALEDQTTLDELAEIADPDRGFGFSPGAACAGMVALVSRYVQWLLASVLVGVVYAWWAGLAIATGALAVRVAIRSGVSRIGVTEAGFAPLRRRRDYYLGLTTRRAPRRRSVSSGCSRGSRTGTARMRSRPWCRCGRLVGGSCTSRSSSRSRSGSGCRS